jgi:hypothetical protein
MYSISIKSYCFGGAYIFKEESRVVNYVKPMLSLIKDDHKISFFHAAKNYIYATSTDHDQ